MLMRSLGSRYPSWCPARGEKGLPVGDDGRKLNELRLLVLEVLSRDGLVGVDDLGESSVLWTL